MTGRFVIPAPGVVVPPPEADSDAERQARSKANLINAGGKRIPVRLPYPAVIALEWIKKRDGHENSTDAVVAAIMSYSQVPNPQPTAAIRRATRRGS